jgi:PmbA protein
MSDPRDAARLALEAVRAAGADASDVVVVESDSLETRVRGEEIDFVKQARERALGIRALMRGAGGARSAITSTCDLAEDAIRTMARETVELARATAEDPAAGLPEDGFADSEALPELVLIDPADRESGIDARIDAAKRAERAARETDPRITNSEGSQASSSFSRIVYGNSAGFLGEYESASHGLFSEPLAQENGSMQRDYWMTAARRLGALEEPEKVGRHAAERAVCRLGAHKVATCEVPVIFDPLTAASLWRQVAGLVSGYAVYRGTSFLAEKLGEPVASEHITLVDDALRPGGLGSRPFDGEGLPSRRTTVLDRGRLDSFLLDTYSARKVGGVSTGNASRSAGSAPGVGAGRRDVGRDHRRHAARSPRHRADRHGLQSHDGRLLARSRGPLDRERRAHPPRRGGHDRRELRGHAVGNRRGRQRPPVAHADRIAERAGVAHDRRGRIMSRKAQPARREAKSGEVR